LRSRRASSPCRTASTSCPPPPSAT
jgi:hypothetical protein